MAALGRGLRSGIKSVYEFRKDLVRTLMPHLCIACDSVLPSSEKWLCRRCMMSLAANAGPVNRVLDPGSDPPLTVAYPLDYTPAVSEVIRGMKYGDKPGLCDVFGPFLAFVLCTMSLSRPVLVPVPLHAAKRRERGYNQSELLSQSASRLTGVEVETGAIRRVRNTPSQAGLDRDRRLCNMRGAFAPAGRARLEGRQAVLIDDVVTTGATLRDCARVLYDSGVREVTACVIASSA